MMHKNSTTKSKERLFLIVFYFLFAKLILKKERNLVLYLYKKRERKIVDLKFR